jgi:copper transport protein
MQTIRSTFILVFVAMAASLSMLSGALAHAALVGSDPADGAVLPAAPPQIVLKFTEPVTPLVITLIAPDGQSSALDTATASNAAVTIPLPALQSRGTYLVSWRVTSADGHPVGGALVFSIGEPGSRPVAGTEGDTALMAAIWLTRTALYAALFLGVGATVFALLVAPLPRPLAPLPRVMAVAGLVLAPLSLGLQGLDALGIGFGSFASASVWSTALGTSYATTVAVAAGAFVATLLSTLLPAGRSRGLVVGLAWLGAGLAPMLSGHAGTAPPVWLSKPAVFVHIAALVFWIGALLPLGWLLRSRHPAALPAIQRFSRLIPLAVAPIVVTGIVLAVLQMGPPGPAWSAPYALLLGAKLVLVALLFGLALWNRLALTRPALAGAEAAQGRLRRSIGIELLLVLVIFAVVAGWRFTPPPRVLAELEARPAQTHIHTSAAMADIAITPGRAGESTMRIWLTDGEFAPIAPRGVTVALSSAALGIERLKRPATLGADGFWQAPLTLPAGGAWSVEIDVRIDDFTLVKLTGEIELRP